MNSWRKCYILSVSKKTASNTVITPVILHMFNPMCEPCMSCLITEVWAVHEMNQLLTGPDKQPDSITIPLSLVFFFRGSKGISHCRIIHRVVLQTMQIQPHVEPPVAHRAQDLSIVSIKRLH